MVAQAPASLLTLIPLSILVTAKHVLFGNTGNDPLPARLELTAYGRDPRDSTKTLIYIDLAVLSQAGHVVADAIYDVVVLRIGKVAGGQATEGKTAEEQRLRSVNFVQGVTVNRSTPIVGVGHATIKRFDDVLVSNRVLLFGYPQNIGMPQQIDFSRPLLRGGIVAGKNELHRTVIVDCPAYGGNSGGPVIEIEESNPLNRNFRVIGVVTQFVPYMTQVAPHMPPGSSSPSVANSGYTVVVPMDPVLAITERMDKTN